MSSNRKFCINCGEKLGFNIEIRRCPKCGTDFDLQQVKQSSTVIESLPYKSPGTAALIAFIGGIFGLPGIGHIYVGKVGRGIAILILGLVLYALTIVFLFAFPPIALILSIGYFIMFIWQIFSARRLAKKFNEIVKTTHKEPW